MFIRKKTTKVGTARHYLVENRREGGKVRQKVLYYLGQFPTADAELAYWDCHIDDSRRQAAYWRGHAADAKAETLDPEHLRRCLALYERRAADEDACAGRCEAYRDNLRSILKGVQRVVPKNRHPVADVGHYGGRPAKRKPAAGGAKAKRKKERR